MDMFASISGNLRKQSNTLKNIFTGHTMHAKCHYRDVGLYIFSRVSLYR